MHCFVYKGDRKADTYLYLTKEGDFSDVPETLLKLMGELEFVLSVDLANRDKLAQADIEVVSSQLKTQGYFVQLPPSHDVEKLLV